MSETVETVMQKLLDRVPRSIEANLIGEVDLLIRAYGALAGTRRPSGLDSGAALRHPSLVERIGIACVQRKQETGLKAPAHAALHPDDFKETSNLLGAKVSAGSGEADHFVIHTPSGTIRIHADRSIPRSTFAFKETP